MKKNLLIFDNLHSAWLSRFKMVSLKVTAFKPLQKKTKVVFANFATQLNKILCGNWHGLYYVAH